MCMFQLVQGVARFIATLNSIHLFVTDKAPPTRYRPFIFKEEIVKVLKGPILHLFSGVVYFFYAAHLWSSLARLIIFKEK